jgi:hypothetical protein
MISMPKTKTTPATKTPASPAQPDPLIAAAAEMRAALVAMPMLGSPDDPIACQRYEDAEDRLVTLMRDRCLPVIQVGGWIYSDGCGDFTEGMQVIPSTIGVVRVADIVNLDASGGDA